MRAVVLSLIGVLAACGLAQAGECKLDGASLVARSQTKWSSEIQRPDLLNREFQVERVASHWRSPKVAEISVLVRSGADAFVVQQVSDFSGAPVDAVFSAAATDSAVQSIKWNERAADAEKEHFSGVFDGITAGPLSHMGLSAKSCT